MYCFSVSGVGVTASFRVPETHTFHQTLPLPSRTNQIGLMGAALGLSIQEVHAFAEKNGIKVSVCGKAKGIMKDLWNYRKVTTKAFNETEMKSRPHYSVLTREYLAYPTFEFVYASENPEALTQVREAFLHPVYALTAGNSDDLLKITAVSEIEDVKASMLCEFENTILPGDMASQCRYDVKSLLRDTPVTFSLRMPEVFSLPTGFTFDGDVRTGVNVSPFTFVSYKVSLREPVEGYVVNGKNYLLY